MRVERAVANAAQEAEEEEEKERTDTDSSTEGTFRDERQRVGMGGHEVLKMLGTVTARHRQQGTGSSTEGTLEMKDKEWEWEGMKCSKCWEQ